MASDAAMMPVLLPIAAAAALAYAVLRHRPEGDALRSLVKTASVACLALAALAAGAPPAIAAGLALGALGDWFLSRPGDRAFLAGMAAFGAGHLAYAASSGRGARAGRPRLRPPVSSRWRCRPSSGSRPMPGPCAGR